MVNKLSESLQSFVTNNLLLIESKKNTKNSRTIKNVWVNTQTGQIIDKAPTSSLNDEHQWTPISFKLKNDQFRASLSSTPLNEDAIKVVEQTLQILNEKQKLKEGKSDESISEIAGACFGKIVSVNSIEQQASEIFNLTTKLLEGKEAVKDTDIVKLYHLLFETDLKDISTREKALNPTHPASIIFNLNDAIVALQSGEPSLAMKPTGEEEGEFEGLNASYYLKGTDGEKLWVFKPSEGEEACQSEGIQTMEGVPPGEGAKREHVAHLLNYHGRYSVPYTAFISLNDKIGSVQAYVPNCEKLKTLIFNDPKLIPEHTIQAISVFDLIYHNGDRHGGNILCQPAPSSDSWEIFAIDHGCCMTSEIDDPLYMEYLTLPQMQSQSFHPETIDLILKHNDVSKNASIMRKHGIEEEAIQWMETVSNLLRIGVEISEVQKKQFEIELSPTDLAIVATKERFKLAESSSTAVPLKYVKNILLCKKVINQMNTKGTLTNQNIANFKQHLLDTSPEDGREWIETLFTYIITPYIKKFEIRE